MTRFPARHPARLLLVLVVATSPVLAQTSIVRATPPTAAIDAIFKRYDSRQTPGCSVAVVDAGKVVMKKSYGMADIALGVPMTSATTSWIPYSEARVFVALAVAMLARDGKVVLDEPIRKYVPQVPAYASAVTVRQLLHHTSGLADYGVLAGPGFMLEDRMSADEFFRILARWGKLGFAPGQGHMYSNTDYALLKMLVESASGDSLHAYLDAKLLRSLGMAATRIGVDQADIRPQHALFHEATEDGYRRLLRYRVSPVGGISLTTSLDDLIRWDRALRDPSLGLTSMLNQLEAGAPPPDADTTVDGYAFGVFRRTHQGLPLVEYHGVGEFTYLVQVPDTQLSVATLCNAYAGMWSFAADVARLHAGPAAGEPTASTPAAPVSVEPPRKPAVAVDVPLAELGRYVGEYRSADNKPRADVTMVDDALVLTARGGPAFPSLVPLGNGAFETTFEGTTYLMTFKASDAGMALTSWDVTANESGGPDLQRWTPWQPDADALRSYTGTYVGDDVEVVLHVRVDGGRVLMASRGFAESPLSPEDKPGLFRLPDFYTARFERDAPGRVIAVVLDAPRVKGIRFSRR